MKFVIYSERKDGSSNGYYTGDLFETKENAVSIMKSLVGIWGETRNYSFREVPDQFRVPL